MKIANNPPMKSIYRRFTLSEKLDKMLIDECTKRGITPSMELSRIIYKAYKEN